MRSLTILLVFSLITQSEIVSSQTNCVKEKICLKVISQRWLTDPERKRLAPLSGASIAVRLRLSNESNDEIVYLAGFDSTQPYGYRLFRAIGERAWDALPRTTQRTEPLYVANSGGKYSYIRLKPNSTLEYEIADSANPSRATESSKGGYDEEHAFSVFIRLAGPQGSDSPIELVTEPFIPLKHDR